MEKSKVILETLEKMYPDAKCELNYTNLFELLVSVVLSAQTTDVKVNKVTKNLFSKYPTPEILSKANCEDVRKIIESIGLSRTKAKNIIALSSVLCEKYNSVVPRTKEELMLLPGVGQKTANVVLAEGYNIPKIAVDTHVFRVSHRLNLSTEKDPLKVEEDLMKIFPMDTWCNLHIRLLFFGRYFCTARNPKCKACPFQMFCTK